MDQKTKPTNLSENVKTEVLAAFDNGDLVDICDATDAAIADGGGFGWLTPPPRQTLESYWRGVVLIPDRVLVVGRLDGVIASSAQILKPPRNNEAQAFACHLTTFFVAPWARGHGLSQLIIEHAEACARHAGYRVINLDVRGSQERAINLFEMRGYTRFGTHDRYAVVDGDFVTGHFYHKEL